MELKYPVITIVAVIAAVAFFVIFCLKKDSRKKYSEGVRIANDFYFGGDEYYRKKKRIYKMLSALLVIIICTTAVSAAVLLARPHKTEKVTDEKYCRDIMLCLDVSTSVDTLNARLVDELKDMVKSLNGERFGITIFNSSPVLVSPLTDDYEYIIEQLDTIETGLKKRNSNGNSFNISGDDWYYYEYIESGTLVDNMERGSSLVGDGLASCAFHFSDDEKDRPRIVIFSTDNDVFGQELITLPEASELCKKKDITVYGIGTKEMMQTNLQEMKKSVEKTGGQFFLEEDSGTFNRIVEKIEESSEGLVNTNSHIVETDYPKTPFIILTISLLSLMFVSRVLKIRG